jgi:hypothetical protein
MHSVIPFNLSESICASKNPQNHGHDHPETNAVTSVGNESVDIDIKDYGVLPRGEGNTSLIPLTIP